MASSNLTLESVKQQVDELASQVKKQSRTIVDTGRQVLKLQVDKERESLGNLRLTTDSESRIPHTESDDEDDEQQGGGQQGFGSEDIVELVTELQGQLDILDDRSIRRTANAAIQNDSDPVAPLPGHDGITPEMEKDDELSFPKTLKEFKEMSDLEVEHWLRWYELLPPDEEELQDILKKAGTTMKDMGVEEKEGASSVEPTQQEKDANYDTLARFLGLRSRRTAGAW